jgi:hypothetical protein
MELYSTTANYSDRQHSDLPASEVAEVSVP